MPAIPVHAFALPRPLDPRDIEVYELEVSQGEAATDILDPDEEIADWSLALTAEAVAAGLIIKTGGAYETTLVDRVVRFYLEVDEDAQALPVFDGSGLRLAIELEIVTDSNPPRRKQRTATVQVANQ